VPRSDRWVGFALALVGLVVMWTARAFPDVPGQKLGASFLPMLVGAGLVLCAIGLVVRGLRAAPREVTADAATPPEHYGSAAVIVGVTLAYILLADRVGFLLIVPPLLVATFAALRVRLGPAIAWAVLGTLVVHFAFYKLLRVPLPWGVLRPFY
jgi:putative tricarboxylic transport membrane protein